MIYYFHIILGIAPSILWLLFYLRKDVHPESSRMVLKIFLWGVAIMLPAALMEFGAGSKICDLVNLKIGFLGSCDKIFSPLFLLYNFLAIAFVEEFLKYLVVREKVLRHHEFDEPIDAMLYMIIVALGFAAVENIFYLFSNETIPQTLGHSFIRFLGPTFLHTLSSGIFGYFLILYFCDNKRKIRNFIFGFFSAVILHGLFNILIIKESASEKSVYLWILVLAMAISAVFLMWAFRKAKKISSVCQIF